MAMTAEHRAIMLVATKEQAAAFLEDLAYLRDISVKPDQSAGELRRASSVLRRLLIDNDITQVAAPRLGRVLFRIPDNRPFYKAAQKAPFTFFGSGGLQIAGIKFQSILFDVDAPPRPQLAKVQGQLAGQTTLVRLDVFLNQHVLCLGKDWVSRADVIKYIAHVGSGVHSGTPELPADKIISRIRRSVSISSEKRHSISIVYDMHALQHKADPEFQYSADAIDPALLELLSAITYLLRSEDVLRLEKEVRDELAGASRQSS